MARIDTFINKLTSFKAVAEQRVVNIIFRDRDFLEGQIRERLADGITSEGGEIVNVTSKGPRDGAYSRRRKAERDDLGLQTGHIDLKETGRLYKSIKYKKTEKGGEIVVNDDKQKVKDLEGFFDGPDLLWGVSDEDAQFVADRNAQEIADTIAKLITG